MRTIVSLLAIAFALITFSSCMTRTVKDANGNVIYSEPVVGTPWQTDKRRVKQVQRKQEALGYP